jgi:hypothetical protein
MPRFRISSGASNGHTRLTAAEIGVVTTPRQVKSITDVLALVQKRYNITGANEEGRILVCHIQASGALTYPAGV